MDFGRNPQQIDYVKLHENRGRILRMACEKFFRKYRSDIQLGNRTPDRIQSGDKISDDKTYSIKSSEGKVFDDKLSDSEKLKGISSCKKTTVEFPTDIDGRI